MLAGVHDRDKVAGRQQRRAAGRGADGETVPRVLRGVAAVRADVAPAVGAGHAAAAERGQDGGAAEAADASAGGRVPGQGEEEEEVPGEEERAEGGQDAVGHTADVHHHVDAVQHSGAAEAVHRGHGRRRRGRRGRRRRRRRWRGRRRGGQQQGVGDAGHVGLFLLPVLHQQHHQPRVLRPVQRHVPHDLRADTQVQVEHPQAAAALPGVMIAARSPAIPRGPLVTVHTRLRNMIIIYIMSV